MADMNPFEQLFTFANKKEEIEHNAGMISLRFLSEIENLCDKKEISRSELAKMLGTSKSYITQLFRGDKNVNMALLAKLQDALKIRIDIQYQPYNF